MKEFGWSIEYTLSLSFPVFLNLFDLIRRVRFDAAIDEFFTPYGAAKYGGKCSKRLFDGRGSIVLPDGEPSRFRSTEEVTPEMIERANQKLLRMMVEGEAELAKAAAGSK
ncbi:MAG: hypothetical protein J6Y54_06815 [Lentisphaeria bacterium]|nr:hypothetical protein [Lentisphaeria bacterium]